MHNILIYDSYPVSLLGFVSVLKENIEPANIVAVNNVEDVLLEVSKQKFDIILLSVLANNQTDAMHIVKSIDKFTIIGLYYDDFSIALQLKTDSVNVKGLLSKKLEIDILVNNIKLMLAGQQILCYFTQEEVMTRLLDDSNLKKEKKIQQKYTNEDHKALAHREKQILDLILKGYRTTDIANSLNIRMSTVSTVKSKILKKENVNNIVELINRFKQ